MSLSPQPERFVQKTAQPPVGQKAHFSLRGGLSSLPWLNHFRSGIYAFFFAPIAFLTLGLGVTSLEFEAAVGQPLSSSQGFLSLVLGTCVLCTIAIHDGFSISGMVVTLAWSVVIGVIQLFGITGLMTNLLSDVDVEDSAVTMQWGLYPVGIMAICVGVMAANYQVKRRMRTHPYQSSIPNQSRTQANGPEQTSSTENTPPAELMTSTDKLEGRHRIRHQSIRNLVTVTSMLLTALAVLIYLVAAPDNTLMVAAHGLKGLSTNQSTSILLGILGALMLSIIAYSTAFSSVGPLIAAVLGMVLPWYFVYPMWASLTGNVATPGATVNTSFALAGPVITALGLTLAALSLGVFMTRRNLKVAVDNH